MTLDTFGERVGYGPKSGSVVSRWESGDRPVPSDRFTRIAAAIDLPAEYLVNPPLTDLERLEELARAAIALEQLDWEREQVELRDAEVERSARRDKRPA
jgi:transcriptional regulator with XRE-family HTH domain